MRLNRSFTAIAILLVALILGACQPIVTPTPVPPMEANMALVRRYYEEIWDQGDLDVADELLAADYQDPFAEEPGPEGVKSRATLLRTAYPDLRTTVEDMLAVGDKVAVRYTLRGTNTGGAFGLPPTGEEVTITGNDIWRIEDGKLAEVWLQSDNLAFFESLGFQLVPPEAAAAPPTAPLEENKALVRRLVEEAWNQGSLDVLDELFATHAVVQIPPDPAALGRDDYEQLIKEMRAGFPDIQLVLEDIVAQGSEVAVRWTASGTHTGEFMGIAATGKEVTFPAIEIFQLANGKISVSWSHIDFLPLYNQLGANPPPFEAKAANATRFPAPAAPAEGDAVGVMAHRFFEDVWEGGNVDVLDEIMAPDYTEENSWQPLFGLPPIQSAEDYKQFVAGGREENPELNNQVEDIIAEGDTLVVRYTLRGTGPIDYTVSAVHHLADGKLQAGWQVADTLTLFRQLGMIPQE